MTSDRKLFHSSCEDIECCALDSGLVEMAVSSPSACSCRAMRPDDDFEGDVSDICIDPTL